MTQPRPETKLPDEIRELFDLEYHEAHRELKDDEQARAKAWKALKDCYHQNAKGEWVEKAADKWEGVKFFSEPRAIVLNEVVDGEQQLYEIPVARAGTYYLNGDYGKSDPEVYDEGWFAEMITAHNAGVRGQDIPVDYDHFMQEAAGWIRGLSVRDGVLYATVKFTDEGERKVRSGEYRYTSMAYVDYYTHPVSGINGKNVLVSLALTNYPALKGNPAISVFSEGRVFAPAKVETESEETQMEIKELETRIEGIEKFHSEQIKTVQAEKDEIKANAETKMAEMQTRIDALEVERQKNMKEQRHQELVTKAESLMPQPGKDTFILRKEQVGEWVEYAEDLSTEKQDRLFVLLSEINGTKVPDGVKGHSGGSDAAPAETAEVMTRELAEQKADEYAASVENPKMRQQAYIKKYKELIDQIK